MDRFNEVPVHLEGERVAIAVVQIEGPLPNGKHLSVILGRETYTWVSLDEIDLRVSKANFILDYIHQHHPEVRVVIFPEYSLPLEAALPHLQAKSDAYRQIIVAGADNMVEEATRRILNRSAIVIPNSPTQWITKRELSQWETGYVDPAEGHDPPVVLTWQHRARRYWMAVHICLDLAFAVQSPLQRRRDPGVYLVPLCTPEIQALRVIADALLRSAAGRACVLCNAVGDPRSVGGSGIMAVTPLGQKTVPAIQLPADREQLTVFEVDFSRLMPPKKSTFDTKSPLGRRYHYAIHSGAEATRISRIDTHYEESPDRFLGVVNPELFSYCGQKMRVAFLRVDSYTDIIAKAQNQDFEILAVLGQHDVMISHLGPEEYDLFYDVNSVVPRKLNQPREESPDPEHRRQPFPYFNVATFFKAHGAVITTRDREIFDAHLPSPKEDELHQVFALGDDWNDPKVNSATRKHFEELRWVLGNTTKTPGKISAVMTVSLDYAGGAVTEPLERFEREVLTPLINRPEVTSAYGGLGVRLAIDYILRMSAGLDSLAAFIEDVHALAHKARILLTTTTYVVIKPLSALSLSSACLQAVLPPADAVYRETHYLPLLMPAGREVFKNLPEGRQRQLIRLFRDLDGELFKLKSAKWFADREHEIREKVARGLLSQEIEILGGPHEFLLGRVEQAVSHTISGVVTDSDLREWQKALNLPSGKTLKKVTIAERIRIALQAIEAGRISGELGEILRQLDNVLDVRNAMVHGRYGELSAESVVETLLVYCQFLAVSQPGTES